MVRKFIVLSLIGITTLCGAPALAQDTATIIRIGVVPPKAQLGQGHTGQDVGEPVRQLIMSYMAGPALELVPLQARIPAQVDAEAQAQSCTHVLYSSVEQKKAGKGMGGLLSKLGPAVLLGPAALMMPSIDSLSGAADASSAIVAGVATQVVSQAAMQSAHDEAIASLMQAQAGTVKAKDEISLSYQIVTVSGAKPPLADTLKAKAKADGEDLLRPLVEQLATNAVSAAIAP